MLYLKHLRFLQPRRSAASTVSQIAGVKPAFRLLSGLTGKCFSNALRTKQITDFPDYETNKTGCSERR